MPAINTNKKYLIAGLLFLSVCCGAREYHIDSQQMFEAASALELHPGDTLLLRRGRTFTGMLAPRGCGAPGRPIRIGAYGDGPRPIIQARGRHIAGVLLKNPSWWEIQGLEVTNTDGSDRDQGDLFGIYALAEDREGLYEHLYISDCFVHHVNGMVAGKRRGGIHLHIKKLRQSRFDDVRITNNRVEQIGGVGIGNTSSCAGVTLLKDGYETRNLWTRVYVADNRVDTTGRNNIIARVSKDAIYERNLLAHSSRRSTGHSIFCFNTDGIRIQYNEAYGNTGPGGIDRGGFDADYNCVHTFIQYNYSHDNNWFCGIMKRPNRHVVIRYNLSQNDREGIYFYGFDKERQAQDIHIYNNTHFIRRGLNVSVFPHDRTPVNTRFENNIFYFEDSGQWGKNATGPGTVFRNNLYFNIAPHPSDPQPVTTRPHFVDPGRAPAEIDLKTMAALAGYRLRSGSAGVGAGLVIPNNGGYDLLKTPLPHTASDLGACLADPGPRQP